jgi:ABC-type transporter Mla subunit MlaD
VLGRKKLSSTTASKMGTAIRSASGASKEAGDVARAKQTAKKVSEDLQALSDALQRDIDALEDVFDAQNEELGEIVIKAKSTDVHIPLLGLAWMPYRENDDGRLEPAW